MFMLSTSETKPEEIRPGGTTWSFCLHGFQCQMENVKLDLIMCYPCLLLMALTLICLFLGSPTVWYEMTPKLKTDKHKLEMKCAGKRISWVLQCPYFIFLTLVIEGQHGVFQHSTWLGCHHHSMSPPSALLWTDMSHVMCQLRESYGIVKLTVWRRKDKIKVTSISYPYFLPFEMTQLKYCNQSQYINTTFQFSPKQVYLALIVVYSMATTAVKEGCLHSFVPNLSFTTDSSIPVFVITWTNQIFWGTTASFSPSNVETWHTQKRTLTSLLPQRAGLRNLWPWSPETWTFHRDPRGQPSQ